MAFSLKDYDIAAEIGQGGFASVFRARQKSLSREVAIKRLSPQRTQNASEILRFRREAEAMAALTHDNIVAVFDYAFHDGCYYIVMEFVDGMTFETALDRGLPQECALFVLEKAAAALTSAHEQNIIHRDIKPANILLGRNGQVKLADFGLALFRTGIESFTSPGSVLGTISYMAPEALVSPKEVDNRIDVFSLGCILYQALAGKHPFAGSDFGEISHHLLNDAPAPLPARVPAPLAAITMRCLEKDREKRPGIAELREALKTSVRGDYHESQEKLTRFVRQDSGLRSSATVPEAAVVPETGEKQTRTRAEKLIAAIVLATVIAAIVLVFHPISPEKKHQASSLPTQPSFSARRGMGETMQEQVPLTAAKDGPAPLTTTVLDMKVGTLVLKGLTVQDTVFLNSNPARVPVSKPGEETQLELLPGHYRLDIRRRIGPGIRRELELVPLERQIIDLEKE
jgi:eukaryotic-like serine/threonine-protein kinase